MGKSTISMAIFSRATLAQIFGAIGLTMAVLVPPFTVALITTNVQAVIQWLVLSILSELFFSHHLNAFGWMIHDDFA